MGSGWLTGWLIDEALCHTGTLTEIGGCLLAFGLLLLGDRNLAEDLLAMLLGMLGLLGNLELDLLEMLAMRFLALGGGLGDLGVLHGVELLHQMVHLALLGLEEHCTLGLVGRTRALAKELGLRGERQIGFDALGHNELTERAWLAYDWLSFAQQDRA